jgi:hypothetical protein
VTAPARIALVLLLSACGGGTRSPSPAKPAEGPKVDPACRTAYAEYERRWRIARGEELASFGDAFGPDAIEEIVSQEVQTLPDHEELKTLRKIYAVVEFLLPETAWVVAFTAAEHAIGACGEDARRPA